MVTDKSSTQAKLLRAARGELAKRVRALVASKDRKGLRALGLQDDRIAAIFGGAAFNSDDLATLLGVKVKTLRGWIAPAGNVDHREMPQTARLLLARILEQARR